MYDRSERKSILEKSFTSDSISKRKNLINTFDLANCVSSSILRFKDVEFCSDTLRFRILPDGKFENLPFKEARLLKLFLSEPNTILSRKHLTSGVWDRLKVSPRTVDSHISRLRKKISSAGVSIESTYGGGYSMK